MTVNNKRFEAAFFQMSETDKDTTGIAAYAKQKTFSRYAQEDLNNMSEQELLVLQYSLAIDWLESKSGKKSVWFMITELYGEYGIVLYYDNKYNESNGEDL